MPVLWSTKEASLATPASFLKVSIVSVELQFVCLCILCVTVYLYLYVFAQMSLHIALYICMYVHHVVLSQGLCFYVYVSLSICIAAPVNMFALLAPGRVSHKHCSNSNTSYTHSRFSDCDSHMLRCLIEIVVACDPSAYAHAL